MTALNDTPLAQLAEHVVSELHDRGLEAAEIIGECDRAIRDSTLTPYTITELVAIRANAEAWLRESSGLPRVAPDTETR